MFDYILRLIIYKCSFFYFMGNQHIQIKMQCYPQNDINNQDKGNVAIR